MRPRRRAVHENDRHDGAFAGARGAACDPARGAQTADRDRASGETSGVFGVGPRDRDDASRDRSAGGAEWPGPRPREADRDPTSEERASAVALASGFAFSGARGAGAPVQLSLHTSMATLV